MSRLKRPSAPFFPIIQAAGILLLVASGTLAATPLFEAESRLAQELQKQIQADFDWTFGPGKSRVAATVRLDLSPFLKERFVDAWTQRAPLAKQEIGLPWPAAGGAANVDLFTKKKEKRAGAIVDSVSPFQNPEFLLSAGVEVKSITVDVFLDDALPATADATAGVIVRGWAPIDDARGDRVSIQRMAMPGLKKRITEDIAFLQRLLEKVPMVAVALFCLAVLFIMGLVTLAIFRKSAYRLAAAIENMGGRGASATPVIDASDLIKKAEALSFKDPAEQSGANEANEAGDGPLDVAPHQMPYLEHILASEPLDKLALILSILSAKTRAAYLGSQTMDRAANIIEAMSRVNVAEPEALVELRRDLAKKIAGSVGGLSQVLDMFRSLTDGERQKLLAILNGRDPALAAEVRSQIVLFSDLSDFSEADLALAVSKVKIETIADALAGTDETFANRFKATLTDRQWRGIEERMAAGRPAAAKVQAARDEIVAAVENLSKTGRLHRQDELTVISPEFNGEGPQAQASA